MMVKKIIVLSNVFIEISFQISRLQLFEMINELFTDTVVISQHEKLLMKENLNIDKLIAFIMVSISPEYSRCRPVP